MRQKVDCSVGISDLKNNSRAAPDFTPTSSPELDEALTRMRQELFIPYGLPIRQQNLIFKKKYTTRLEEEKLITHIGQNEEEYRLQHKNPMAMPTKKDAWRTLALMKTKEDWANLIPFLEGLKQAGRVVKPNRWEWLTRRAGACGTLGTILKAAQLSEQTGFTLWDYGVAKRFFFELHRMAHSDDFAGPATSRALTLAKQTATLMEEPVHTARAPSPDPKCQPFIIGVMLELYAARALSEAAVEGDNDQVRTFVKRLLGAMLLLNVDPGTNHWPTVDHMLEEIVPVYNGMKLALKVEGMSAKDKDIGGQLKKQMVQLEEVITAQKKIAPKAVQEKPSRGYRESVSLAP